MKTIRLKFTDGIENVIDKQYLVSKLSGGGYEIEISDKPDYLICSCFSGEHLYYDCVKIVIIAENITPDFNLYDYAVGFDYLSYGDRYIRIPNYVYYKGDLERAGEKHLMPDAFFMNRDKFCNLVSSNTKMADSSRKDFFLELSKYKKVDSGGKLLNNIGKRVENKYEFQKDYKFSIAFENSKKDGYTTEKIVQAWKAGTIPIYWGNPRISQEFNREAFINVHDFGSYESCINYIKKVDNDDKLYMQIQKQSIFTEDSIARKYYDEPDLLIDFLCSIFERPLSEAKRIFNNSTGYTKIYYSVMKRGWMPQTVYHKIRNNK